MDSEYKLSTLLIYLLRTIRDTKQRNHMHCAGSHETQIPTLNSCSNTNFALEVNLYNFLVFESFHL